MKKVLITGASGSIGMQVIRYLLSEGKYEITALDLKNKSSLKKLKKYNKRINIIYGDICDKALMYELVKEEDVIIHLASVMPPLTEFNKKISEIIEYNGTKSIIDAINKNNKNCYLLYASTTSIYDNSLTGSIEEIIKKSELTNYSLWKYKTENLIKKDLKNYTILRIPLVLNNVVKDSFMFNIKKNIFIEITTNKEAAYAFVLSIANKNKLNKKIFNVGMGSKGRVLYKDILYNILKYEGISMKYLLSRIFLDKNYHSPILSDSDKLEDIIHYRYDSLNNYYKRLYNYGKKRRIRKVLAKPFLILYK